MKRILSFGIALAMLVAFSGIASAATIIEKWADAKGSYPGSTVSHDVDPSNRNAGGIVWSRHNLSAYGEHYKAILTAAASVGTRTDSRIEIKASLTGSQGEVLGTTQICLFCHTSHHSTAQTGPLWNRNATGTYTAYSKYGPGTIAGTTTGPSGLQAENVYGGSSLACLSCHDGVTEMDNIINAPGNGSRTDGTNGDQEWVFLENDMVGGGAMRAAANAKTRTVIGEDLTNDHPIEVVYSIDGRASLRPLDTVLTDISMVNARSLVEGESTEYGRSDNYWAVFGYINASATIGDLLRNGKVACESCHDPHYRNQTNNDPGCEFDGERNGCGPSGSGEDDSDGLFFRRVGGNSNSGVCRTCHNK